jgi:alkanesulfonate monooxygenase SsuD/methylene tetrahydromethanopterin reductase-like flavin-dependent oxidoreductase (luciferase family)
MGGGSPDQFSQGAEKLHRAWAAAGRDGSPRTMALGYFALGDRAEEAADRYLRDYYAFMGDSAGMVADSAAKDAATVRQHVEAFAAVGCDELVLFPCDPDPDQVDLLADALR